jgi:hypothetical protein
MAGCTTSSNVFSHAGALALGKGSDGRRGGEGKTSSTYWQITEDSRITLPSCTSVGTTPFGLSFRYSGRKCSNLRSSRRRSAQARFFSESTMRTLNEWTEFHS